MDAPAPEVADHEAATCPLPNCCATRAGTLVPVRIADLREDHGPRLDPIAARFRVRKPGIAASRCLLLVLGLPHPDPGLEPALAGQYRACIADAGAGLVMAAIQVDRQELADRRAVVLPLGERVGAAEHQEPTAALADEVPRTGASWSWVKKAASRSSRMIA